MKVVLVYRQRRPGAYSIEALFHAIADELRKEIEVIEYVTGGRLSVLQDAWSLRKLDADIYHITGDINYLVFMLPRIKTVVTVHDIGHYLYGLRGIKRWIYKWLWLIWPIRRAAAVTTVSKATKENVVRHLGIAGEHLTTIDNCYSPEFRYIHRDFNSDKPVVLQIGTNPHKNVERIICALNGITCKLVLVGQLDVSIRQHLTSSRIDYESLSNLSSEEIIQRYINCDLVTFVSLGEGFGMPIIEAQASGRPLVTSDISPMNEVAGCDSCQVSPQSVPEIRSALLKIISDDAYRGRIVKAGLQNVKRYSPQTISKRYHSVYAQVIAKGARRVTLYQSNIEE